MKWILITTLLLLASIVSATPHSEFPNFSSAESGFTQSGNTVSVSDNIVYNQGWYSVNGGSWQSFSLSGSYYSGSNSWIANSASSTLSSLGLGTHYVIIYSCSLTNNNWDCHGNQWQLKVIKNTQTPTEPVDPINPTVSKKLIAHYKFENNADDATSNNNDGVLIGETSFAAGVLGKGAFFEGTGLNDYVRISNSDSLQSISKTGAVTFSAWIKPRVIDWSGIIGSNVAKLHTSDAHNNLVLTLDVTSTGRAQLTKYDVITKGEWQYVAMTYDASTNTASIYRNGVLLSSKTISGAKLFNTGSYFYIGQAWGDYFNGVIDETKIWNYALSSSQILADYKLITAPVSTVVTCADVSCGETASCSNGKTCDNDDNCLLLQEGQGDCDCTANCAPGLYCEQITGTDYCCPTNTKWDGSKCASPLVAKTCADFSCGDTTICSGSTTCHKTPLSCQPLLQEGQSDCDCDANCAAGLVCKYGAGDGCCKPTDTWDGTNCIAPTVAKTCADVSCGETASCSNGQTCDGQDNCILLTEGKGDCDCDANCASGLRCEQLASTDYCCPPDTNWDGSKCATAPSCGDNTCNNGETCSTCSADCGSCSSGGTAVAKYFVVDHTDTDIRDIPSCWITKVKSDLHVAYEHTSHGSQLVSGMKALESYSSTYNWEDDGSPTSALDFDDDAMARYSGGIANDLGAERASGVNWWSATRYHLNNNNHINVVMWSWCNIAGHDIPEYLSEMTKLMNAYPKVTFVFMTGHVNGGGIDDSSDSQNKKIRSYCKSHNCVLFDFADMDEYDPDGNYFLDNHVQDSLHYDSTPPYSYSGFDSNWADQYIARHPTSLYNTLTKRVTSCAHSHYFNCAQKGQATWHLLARIAGWNGRTGSNANSCN